MYIFEVIDLVNFENVSIFLDPFNLIEKGKEWNFVSFVASNVGASTVPASVICSKFWGGAYQELFPSFQYITFLIIDRLSRYVECDVK